MADKKKKVAKKKKATKESKKMEISVIRQYSKEVPYELNFVMTDGRRLKNIFELIDVLDNMNDDMFKYHVNEKNNDFSNWIEGVLEEKDLAKKIKNLSTRIETQNTLLKHLINQLK